MNVLNWPECCNLAEDCAHSPIHGNVSNAEDLPNLIPGVAGRLLSFIRFAQLISKRLFGLGFVWPSGPVHMSYRFHSRMRATAAAAAGGWKCFNLAIISINVRALYSSAQRCDNSFQFNGYTFGATFFTVFFSLIFPNFLRFCCPLPAHFRCFSSRYCLLSSRFPWVFHVFLRSPGISLCIVPYASHSCETWCYQAICGL